MICGYVKYSIKILAVIEPDRNLIPAGSCRGPEPRKVVQVMELNFERTCWEDLPISIYAIFVSCRIEYFHKNAKTTMVSENLPCNSNFVYPNTI